jgi:subtilisin family serine protease
VEEGFSCGKGRAGRWGLLASLCFAALAAVGAQRQSAAIEVGRGVAAPPAVLAVATTPHRSSPAAPEGANEARAQANVVSGDYKPNELLVRGADAVTLAALLARGWRQDGSEAGGVVRLISRSGTSAAERDRLQSEFPDAHFALNYVYRHATDKSAASEADRGAGKTCSPEQCYGPALIKWHASLAACANGVRVGVIDTDIDKEHPALAWRELRVRRFPQEADAVKAPDSHGTAVVSLLAGDPKSLTSGLIPGADYVIVDAFYSNEQGETEVDTIHLVWALRALRNWRAQVINMSFFGPSDDTVHMLVSEMSRSGVVFVAAAGNGGPTAAPAYPAAYPEVIAVTAVDQNKVVYAEANHGGYIDMAAPGVRIWTALPNNKQGVLSGTSFAAPFVTAIAAVTYNATPMKTGKAGAGAVPDPKAELLARLSFDKLGTGQPGERDQIFGLGLVRAPLTCGSHSTMQAQKQQGFTWKRWGRQLIRETLKLFNSYKVRGPQPSVAPAG